MPIAAKSSSRGSSGKIRLSRKVLISPEEGQQTIHFPTAQVRTQLKLDPKNLEIVRNAMLLDVTHKDASGRIDGTGHRAAVDGMQVCGKTGTAQVMEGRKLKEYMPGTMPLSPTAGTSPQSPTGSSVPAHTTVHR